jgi:hypothetical protein
MTSIVSHITLDGPPGPVFDLVTTARFWPRWYPISKAVAGVTERPYQLGDLIREHLENRGIMTDLLWRVAEHVRPCRIVLQCEAPRLRISYLFERRDRGTQLRREMEYEPSELRRLSADPEELRRHLNGQADLALARLRELVEGILRQEAVDVGKVRATPAPAAQSNAPADLAAAVGAAASTRLRERGR